MTVEPIPKRYRYSVTPHIFIKGASAAIEFYKQTFGATEISAHRNQTVKLCAPKSESAFQSSCWVSLMKKALSTIPSRLVCMDT